MMLARSGVAHCGATRALSGVQLPQVGLQRGIAKGVGRFPAAAHSSASV
jgi:hypothetical protein